MERVFDVLFSGFALLVLFPLLVPIVIILRCSGEGEIMGYSGEYVEAPTYPGSVSRRCPDISKAKANLSYNPKISLKEGLKRHFSWANDFLKK